MSVSRMIEKQVAMWNFNARQGEPGHRPGRHRKDGVDYGPCLLFSSELGSGGTAIARIAGERLGWPVFDREIVDQIAQLAHVRKQLIESVDERVRTKWEEVLYTVLQPGEVDSDLYMAYLHQVVMSLGHHGDVVIVGRGAQHMLPSQCALRVRVVAPMNMRIERVTKVFGLTEPQARDRIREMDSARAEFIRKSFHKDIGLPLNYDLILNTAEWGFEKSAGIVLAALEHKLGVVASATAVPA